MSKKNNKPKAKENNKSINESLESRGDNRPTKPSTTKPKEDRNNKK